MNSDTAFFAFRECIEGNWPVQITIGDDITFDFKHQLHADVLFETLKHRGFEVVLNPGAVEGDSLVYYYARVS